jgi:pimeloyl-ACP methyl ester carboxylesterase
MLNQIYVEKLIPTHHNQLKPYPILFIAGAAQTGTNWLETPDGRPGWASFFLELGYVVYLSDQPSRGRSPWHPSQGTMVALSATDIECLFTAPEKHNLWPQAKHHAQWPGTGRMGDPIFDAFYASQIQFQADDLLAEDTNAKAYTALIEHVGQAFIITHSQAGAFGWRVGDARPDLVRGIVALEPTGPPFIRRPPLGTEKVRPYGITEGAVAYEPDAGPDAALLETVTVPARDAEHCDAILQVEPARKLKNLARIPVLVVTAEASYHAQYDWCTVAFLRQAGVQVEHLELGEVGIRGNGHMMFMEGNCGEIAERVAGWLARC